MSQVILITGSPHAETKAIGAYQVANVLRQNGYSVQVIDCYPEAIRDNFPFFLKTLDKFLSKDTLWVGFSTTFLYYDGKRALLDLQKDINRTLLSEEKYKELRDLISSRNPKCCLVAGGAKSKYSKPNEFDVYISGYADISAVQFTRFCEGKALYFPHTRNEDGSITVDSDTKASTFNFTGSTFRWHDNDIVVPGSSLPIELSRGCIFKCAFCAFPLNGKKKLDYIKDPAILVDHLQENYERFGSKDYIFSDDTYNDSMWKMEMLFNKVFSKLKFKISFGTYLRLDLIHAFPDSIALLRESGLKSTFFGIESLHHKSNKAVGKGLAPEKVISTLHKVRAEWPDVMMQGGFIVGLPYESETSAREWLDIITQKDFPLDGMHMKQLLINNPMSPWQNLISEDPKKFGFETGGNTVTKHGDASEVLDWTNSTGLTFSKAAEISKEYTDILTNNGKIRALTWPVIIGAKSMGLDFARGMDQKKFLEDYVEKRRLRVKSYFSHLINL